MVRPGISVVSAAGNFSPHFASSRRCASAAALNSNLTSSFEIENAAHPWMSGANAPKLTGPLSITVKNFWILNLCASEKEFCRKFGNIALLFSRNGNQTVLHWMCPLPNLIFQRDRCFSQICFHSFASNLAQRSLDNLLRFPGLCRAPKRFRQAPTHPHSPSHKGKACHSNGPQTPAGTSPRTQSSASPPHRPADKRSAPACSWPGSRYYRCP
jgi:hypothetical protein